MANWLSRKTELINETDEVLQVRVHREDAPEGYSDLAICLKPHKHKDIRSTKFRDDDDDSGRVSVITVERQDGDYLTLTADDFVSNIRLIFRINNNKLALDSSKSDGRILTDLIRFLPSKFWAIGRSRPTRESNERRDVDEPTRESNERRDVDDSQEGHLLELDAEAIPAHDSLENHKLMP